MTGNAAVDQLSGMEITGNVIPSAWYRTIRKETGKPYLNAIIILSDIVYWYRAIEVRDEESGEFLGYKKKFKADILQRSYQQIAEQFGISKRDASNAIVALEKLGVVKRIFRKIKIDHYTIPNVMYLALDVEVLRRLTYPGEKKTEDGNERKPEEQGGSALVKRKETEVRAGETVKGVEIKPAKRKEDIQQEWECMPQIGKGVFQGRIGDTADMRGTNTEITYKDYNKESLIASSYKDTREEFKRQIEYDILKHDLGGTEELDELVEIASEVLTSTARTIRVNREERVAAEVKERYRTLNMLHIQYVLRCISATTAKIRNIRAVMVTALYNASSTMSAYYGNLYRCHAVGVA